VVIADDFGRLSMESQVVSIALKVQHSSIASQSQVRMPCLTTSSIELRESASFLTPFSVVRLEILSSSFVVTSVGFMSMERFPLRSLACT